MPWSDITPVHYSPPPEHRHAVEVIPASVLRARVAAVPDRGLERVDFHALLHVTAGHYEHTVDFERHRCRAGSCLLIRPGQVHRFGAETGWDGWMVVFRSELLPPVSAEGRPHPPAAVHLPTHVHASGSVRDAIVETIARMAVDSTLDAPAAAVDALLGAQVDLLVGRLLLAEAAHSEPVDVDPVLVDRYHEFRALVDREFRHRHLVGPYARELGCSTRTLNRTTAAVAGVTAKSVIVDRIVLEARRALAHTSRPVASIGVELGFDEPTNFVKFFRRETGSTPGAFRAAADGAVAGVSR